MILRVYTDTSVIGGCLDEEFAEDSQRLLGDCRKGRFRVVISDLTVREIQRSPLAVRAVLKQSPLRGAQIVALDNEADARAEEHIREGIVSEANRVDALHIPIATVGRVDVLVSWNFRHIVNLKRIRGFNSVNLRMGCPQLEIRSPREVTYEET